MRARHLVAAVLALLPAAAAVANETKTYTYDAKGRLIKAESRVLNSGGSVNAYQYDAADNRTRLQSSGQYVLNTLASNQSLYPGQVVMSGDTRFRLVFGFDSSLILYDQADNVLWNAGTTGYGGTTLVMQADGNLVMYAVNTPVWDTSTSTYSGASLVVQNDGNAVIYTTGAMPVWASNTCCR